MACSASNTSTYWCTKSSTTNFNANLMAKKPSKYRPKYKDLCFHLLINNALCEMNLTCPRHTTARNAQ
eukprot:scaffold98436_cov61-Attheya_sp.AAC.3